jgi:hypothetical protein
VCEAARLKPTPNHLAGFDSPPLTFSRVQKIFFSCYEPFTSQRYRLVFDPMPLLNIQIDQD